MEKIGLNKLRSLFLDFYKSKGHYVRKSYSLIPKNDKSLLIINSGMAPLKPYFAGTETPPSKRMATCQKCIRTGDIDNVGYTSRHATFFEMLGSFSFGDYFKEESIVWGWEFLIDVLKMPEDRLWPSIYEEDDEAYKIWREVIGVPDEKIVRLGKEDNFWEIGIGPCGPCSEIYFDRGEKYGCGSPDCKPGCECDRYVEFWNHVFTQFNRDSEGNYTPLKHKNIDTGMGLERLACIMQGVDSIFDVDTIRYIRDKIVQLSGIEYKEGKTETDVSIRIITDHIRSITFMVADGILPSNEGRGYVLRRLLRRAARHGRLLGINEGFLANLSNKVVEVSGEAYPELQERKDYIHRILSIEEEKFSKTIDQGSQLLAEHIKELEQNNQNVLSGDKVFRLYDTYGFPLELTQEILEEHGCKADEEGFNKYMEEQKNLARSARKSEDDEGWADDSILLDSVSPTEFVGYDKFESVGKVLGIIKDKKIVESIDEGIARIYLDKTPFYAESGGQASDTGIIYNDNFKAEVISVSNFRDIYIHRIKVIDGTLNVNDTVNLEVSRIKRNETARNHTATHLLHQTLKEAIGQHVEQAGSSVTDSGLRFDFTHFEAIEKSKLLEIERIINEKISSFLPVKVEQLSYDDALETGAVAQFGEKYGDIVRVVSVGDYSCELCGGTHVENSGQIGAFKILSESGIAAGVRRIEAITGTKIYEKLNDNESILFKAGELLKTNPEGLLNRINTLNEEVKIYKKELEQYKETALAGEIEDIINEAEEKNGVRLIAKAFDGHEVNDLRSLSDKIKEKSKNSIILLASINGDRVTFILSITDDLLDKGYHAGKMIKEIAAAAGGGGGGKADMAQAGAKDPSKVKDAFSVASSLI
ncbi:MAG: alanine--tRNA ligase [Clostridiales bacterium]|nr:alanine--tRNA ligase [Clostridiales bacterium]